mmetsp:Transcript_45651/g.67352  ORF Transcript_45651/g.67352 Transcript_45651/m.67352 type:complete len:347 (-) Transcript_45651:457-1497(-)
MSEESKREELICNKKRELDEDEPNEEENENTLKTKRAKIDEDPPTTETAPEVVSAALTSTLTNGAVSKPSVNAKISVPSEQGNADSDTSDKNAKNGSGCYDVCKSLSIKQGDRLEILWDLNPEGTTASEEKKETRWWGATLLPIDEPVRYYMFDEEDEQNTEEKSSGAGISGSARSPVRGGGAGERVPIRVLDYDPHVEGGYPERSLSQVAFLSDKLVYDIGVKATLVFRREGSTWEPNEEDMTEAVSENGYVDVAVAATKESVLPILEMVLCNVLKKVQPRMAALTAEQQIYVAERIAAAKEKMAEKLVKEMQKDGASREITPDIINMCMEEVGHELTSLRAVGR